MQTDGRGRRARAGGRRRYFNARVHRAESLAFKATRSAHGREAATAAYGDDAEIKRRRERARVRVRAVLLAKSDASTTMSRDCRKSWQLHERGGVGAMRALSPAFFVRMCARARVKLITRMSTVVFVVHPPIRARHTLK